MAGVLGDATVVARDLSKGPERAHGLSSELFFACTIWGAIVTHRLVVVDTNRSEPERAAPAQTNKTMQGPRHSPALGRLVVAPKATRDPKIEKGDHIVVVAHAKPQSGQGDGESESVDLFVTNVKAYALAVQRAVVCGDAATNEVKRDALMARAHVPQGILSGTDTKTLGRIMPQHWRAELLGEGLQPISEADLDVAMSCDELIGKVGWAEEPRWDADGVFKVSKVRVVLSKGHGEGLIKMTWTDCAGGTACEEHGLCYVSSIFTADANAPAPQAPVQPQAPPAGQRRAQVDIGMFETVVHFCTKLPLSSKLAVGDAPAADLDELLDVLRAVLPEACDTLASVDPANTRERKRICQKAMIQVDAKLQIHCRKTASTVFMPARDSEWTIAQVTARLQALLWGPPGSAGYPSANVNNIDKTKHPRLFELRKHVSEGEWNGFMDKALIKLMDADTRANTTRTSVIALGKVERAIARGGAQYTAEKIAAGTVLMDGDSLYDLLEAASENAGLPQPVAANAPPAANAQQAAANVPQQPVINVMQPDFGGTDGEQRIRQIILSTASKVFNDPSERRALEQMADAAVNAPANLYSQLSAAPERVQRLLLSGEESARAINGQIGTEVSTQIGIVRGVLDRRMEKAFTGTEQHSSPRIKAVLKKVRLGNIAGSALCAFLDVDGKWSHDDPLQAFAELDRGNEKFFAAVNRLGHAWGLAQPQHAAQITAFCGRLSEFVRARIDEGAEWPSLSAWYKELMNRVDSQRRQYELKESSVLRIPPDVSWIEDRSTRYSVALSSAVSRTVGQRAAREEAKKVADANAAETKKMEKELVDLKRALAARKNDKPDPKKNKIDPKKQDPKKTVTPPPPAGVGEFDGRSRKEQEKHLMSTIGMKPVNGVNKYPCIFFFTASKPQCHNHAKPEDCKGHHIP